MSKERTVAEAMLEESAERIRWHYKEIDKIASGDSDYASEKISHLYGLIRAEENSQQTLLTLIERVGKLEVLEEDD